MKHSLPFTVVLLFPGMICLSAVAETPDTLLNYSLNEVCIVQPRTAYYSDAFKVKTFGREDLAPVAARDAGQLLSAVSSAFVKSYGAPGNLTSLSFRGTFSNHTQVTWNGFPLNSPTTGDADLSMIPLTIADKVSLVYGASGSLYGGGTFGGSVDLTSSPSSEQGFSSGLSTEAGSYGSWFTAGNIGYSGKKVSVKSIFFTRNAENRYPYKDIYKYGSPVLTLHHNQLRSYGMFHTVSFNINPSRQIQAGIWYQDRFKNLPAVMGSYIPSVATQKDSTLKIFLRYVRTMRRSSLVFRNAFFNDNLFYNDSVSRVHSDISAQQYLADINFRNIAGKRLTWDAGGTFQHVQAQVDSYGRRIAEERFAVFTAARIDLKAFIINTAFRLEVIPGIAPVPLPSAGIKKNFLNNHSYVRASVAAKYRPPTLNEKYWQPGGNPNLLPEKGYTSEIGTGLSFTEQDRYNLTFDLTAFSTHINDLIVWTGEGNFFNPVNYKKVWARGAEFSFAHSLVLGSIKIRQQGEITAVRSTSTAIYYNTSGILGKQLRYVPLLNAFYSGTVQLRRLSLTTSMNYTGKRYITDDHSGRPLPSFILAGLSAAFQFRVHTLNGQLYARADNLFNTSYQIIKGYPMPGRFLAFGLQLGFQR